MSDYQYEKLKRSFDETMKSKEDREKSKEDEELEVLYGDYEPLTLTVTLTHIINNKAGIG